MDRLIPSPHNVVTIATLEVSLISFGSRHWADLGLVSFYFECHRVDTKRPSCILPTHAVAKISYVITTQFCLISFSVRAITHKSV
jgi:hypothetical protein